MFLYSQVFFAGKSGTNLPLVEYVLSPDSYIYLFLQMHFLIHFIFLFSFFE